MVNRSPLIRLEGPTPSVGRGDATRVSTSPRLPPSPCPVATCNTSLYWLYVSRKVQRLYNVPFGLLSHHHHAHQTNNTHCSIVQSATAYMFCPSCNAQGRLMCTVPLGVHECSDACTAKKCKNNMQASTRTLTHACAYVETTRRVCAGALVFACSQTSLAHAR